MEQLFLLKEEEMTKVVELRRSSRGLVSPSLIKLLNQMDFSLWILSPQ
jgi:hypothetical protein